MGACMRRSTARLHVLMELRTRMMIRAVLQMAYSSAWPHLPFCLASVSRNSPLPQRRPQRCLLVSAPEPWCFGARGILTSINALVRPDIEGGKSRLLPEADKEDVG